MTEVTKERVKELREYVRTGRLLVTGDPADVSALINAIDDYAKVKAENEELLTTLSHHQHDLFYEKQAREKAEAENERLREENGVFDSELGRLRMENEKWCAREEKK
jgi:hypothetical protein